MQKIHNDFRPSPGKTLHMPGGHGVRLDTHVYSAIQFRQITIQ
jgi:acetyl-CoA carboxylase biotin carboxylase subunit